MFNKSFVLLIFMLMLVVACSPGKNSAGGQSEFSIQGVSSTNPMMMFARNSLTGKRISKLFSSGEAEFKVTFPNGTWDFSIVSWDGASSFTGNASCYSTSKVLSGTSVAVDVSLLTSNCSEDIYGGTDNFDSTYGFKKITFHNCSDLDSVTDVTGNCDGLKRGFVRSFKISLMEVDEVDSSEMSVGLESACVAIDSFPEAVSSSIGLPVSAEDSPFVYAFKGYDTTDCTGIPDTTEFTQGLSDENVKTFADSNSQHLYFQTEGAVKVVSLYEEVGSACDFGAISMKESLDLNASGGPYLLRGIDTSGSGNYPLILSDNLSPLSGQRLLATTVNPVGEESLKTLIKFGTKVYFVTLADNNYTRRLYSYDGATVTDITPNITVVGSGFTTQSGIQSLLFTYGTTIYFNFKDTDVASALLCSHDTLSGISSCGIDDSNYTSKSIVVANDHGVFYLATDTTNSNNLSLIRFSGASHNVVADLSATSTSIYATSVYSVGSTDYFSFGGSPSSGVYSWFSGLFTDLATTATFSTLPGFGSEYVHIRNGSPFFLDGTLTPVDLDTRATMTLNSGGGSLGTSYVDEVGDLLYLWTNRGGTTYDVWAFNKSDLSFTQVTFIASSNSTVQSVKIGSTIYFNPYTDSTGSTLYSISGLTYTPVSTVNPSGYNISSLKVFNSKVYFTANDGISGYELWSSDGTPAGTSLYLDLNPGSSNSWATVGGVIGDYLILEASGKVYRSKGTMNSTACLSCGTNLSLLGGATSWEDRMFYKASSYSPNMMYLFYLEAQ